MHPCVSYAFYNKMRKKMRKMMCKMASMRKMMGKIVVMRKMMRKTMRKITFMRKMMRKMKISSFKGEYSKWEQHKPFECIRMSSIATKYSLPVELNVLFRIGPVRSQRNHTKC